MTGPAAPARAALGIGPRMLLLVGIGALGPIALIGWAAVAGLSGLSDQVLVERRAVAGAIALRTDHEVRSVLELLSAVPDARGFDIGDADPAPEQEALRAAHLRLRVLDVLVLATRDGRVIAREPDREQPSVPDIATLTETAGVLATGRPMVSSIVNVGGEPAHVFLVPIRDRTGHVAAILGGIRKATEPSWAAMLKTAPAGAVVDLLDAHAVVAASNVGGRAGRETEGAVALGPWLSRRQPAAEIVANDEGGREVIALSPLTIVPWAVSVRQAEDHVFGAAYTLRRRVLAIAPLVAGFALLFAWGAARSVRLPLAVLGRAARRITEGDLSRPVPPLPRDEIGELGESLERMRRQLADSMDRITRHAQDLETKVAERTRDLAAARDALEAHNAQRGQLLRKVITAQEEERKRLARELHDETCQKVAALGIRIDTALGAESMDVMRERLGDARSLASRTLDDIHHVIFALRPSVLDDLGLLPAIRWYATRQLEPKGIAVHYDFPDTDVRVPPEVETALFRAVQEAVSNIARHSRAENALIEIDARPGDLVIRVEDDGAGFDVAGVQGPSESGRGLGLLGLRERMELLGGTVEVDSSPGDGTRVTFEIRNAECGTRN